MWRVIFCATGQGALEEQLCKSKERSDERPFHGLRSHKLF